MNILKEGLRNYQFDIIEDIISDIVFEHIPFDENTRELENKFKNISNKITFAIILCVIVLLK